MAYADRFSKILQATRLDPSSGEVSALLRGLQANILEGHGRSHALHIFLRFTAKRELAARVFLQSLAARVVTTAEQQRLEAQLWRQSGGKLSGGTVGSVLLSFGGYRKLGLPDALAPDDPCFRAGMAERGGILNDPAREGWEPPYRNVPDAMVLLADDDADRLARLGTEALRGLEQCGELVHVEAGTMLIDASGRKVEHFGYKDGLSQPLFFKEELLGDGARLYDATAPLGIACIVDPLGDSPLSLGSYVVYRKLAQDVRRFRRDVAAFANALGLAGTREGLARAGALFLGRFTDGTPIALHEAALGDRGATNDFDASSDPPGDRCPKAAHTRRMNPREAKAQSTQSGRPAERPARIVRRGIPYGPVLPLHDLTAQLESSRAARETGRSADEVARESERGLLFLGYQADISAQFETLQRRANGADGNPFDPVAGQVAAGKEPPAQDWPKRWGESGGAKASFAAGGWVSLRGGGYFFAPSIAFLRSIGNLVVPGAYGA